MILVAGSPCAGKSTFVREHMRAGDMVVDYDALIAALGGAGRSHFLRRYVIRARNAILREVAAPNIGPGMARLPHARRVWVVKGAPTRQERAEYRERFGARVVVVETPERICLARALAERPPEWRDAVSAWFRAYVPDDRDERVSGGGGP
ncbi:AAA family ATPase [Longimycelium tulufanense]|uniref:AAA family ATPase n=1 Tax=Longimycelium tulufanense TaxID=907463 RepID=UPI001668EAF2|nr:AAA family ATPase [Longimycelium tulufanense]